MKYGLLGILQKYSASNVDPTFLHLLSAHVGSESLSDTNFRVVATNDDLKTLALSKRHNTHVVCLALMNAFRDVNKGLNKIYESLRSRFKFSSETPS